MVALFVRVQVVVFALTLSAVAQDLPGPDAKQQSLPVARVESSVWPTAGTCILHGGGKFTGEEIETLRKGGTALAYICSSELPLSEEDRLIRIRDWGARGFDSIDFIHIGSREQAFDPELEARIDRVRALFVSGGKQEYLTRYTKSPVVAAIRRLLERDGVLMGSSAGTAILGKRAILKRRTDDMGAVELIEDDGWDILPDLISDQHLLTKGREEHLPLLLEKYPCEGLGVDDDTAVIVRFSKHGPTLSVVGNSEVHYFRRPVMTEKPKVIKLRKGDAPFTLAFSR